MRKMLLRFFDFLGGCVDDTSGGELLMTQGGGLASTSRMAA